MTGYDQYLKMLPQLQGAYSPGSVQSVQWADDGQSFTYAASGKRYRFDIGTLTSGEITQAPVTPAGGRGAGRQGGPPPAARGGLEQAQNEMPASRMDGCPTAGPAR